MGGGGGGGGGGRGGGGEICHVFHMLKGNRSVIHFCGWWRWGVQKLVIFCGRHK